MSVPRRYDNEPPPDMIIDYAPRQQFAYKQPDNPEDLNKPIPNSREQVVHAPVFRAPMNIDSDFDRRMDAYKKAHPYAFQPPIDIYPNLVPGGTPTPPPPEPPDLP